jgi:acyl-CoA reductase-like NAD-dependent aldehyde dehydrogenase
LRGGFVATSLGDAAAAVDCAESAARVQRETPAHQRVAVLLRVADLADQRADPRVRKVSFTGSTATGIRLAAIAGIKKLSWNWAPPCPVIVLPDADIDTAASAVAVGGYINAGLGRTGSTRDGPATPPAATPVRDRAP